MPRGKKKTVVKNPVIILNDKYQVEISSHCLVLRKAISQEEKEGMKIACESNIEVEENDTLNNISYYLVIGYFTSWEYLGKTLIRTILRDKELATATKEVDMKKFLSDLDDTSREVKEMFSSIDSKYDVI